MFSRISSYFKKGRRVPSSNQNRVLFRIIFVRNRTRLNIHPEKWFLDFIDRVFFFDSCEESAKNILTYRIRDYVKAVPFLTLKNTTLFS